MTQNEARTVWHLIFEAKRLLTVGNKRISQFFDSAREPRSRVIARVDSKWVFLLLSFYIVISWNMPLFKVWSEDKVNKKFVVAENFVCIKGEFCSRFKMFTIPGNTRNDQSSYFWIYRLYFVHSFVGAFESLLKSPLNVSSLKTTFLLKLRTSVR